MESRSSFQLTGILICYIAVSLCVYDFHRVLAFQAKPSFVRSQTRLCSSVGDGNGKPPPPDDRRNEWDEFLNPDNEESESMQKAREFMSESSLPISFDAQGQEDSKEQPLESGDSSSSALVGPSNSNELLPGSPSQAAISKNPYMAVVSKLSPSDLISRFTKTAHPRVQNAVRSTILGLIGGLPKMAFDTTTITTGQRLASLMFQLQMTGYMFKNAEYKLTMQHALGVDDETRASYLLKGVAGAEDLDPLQGKIRGKLRVRYGPPKNSTNEDENKEYPSEDATGGTDIEVDAAAYMSELRSEVSKLRDELMVTHEEQEEALRKDLLLYIRTLPEKELRSLTNTISQDVLIAMKGLVNAVMAGIGEGKIGPETVTEQSGEAMAQLCMWQLAIGYNLRTLEVREEMKKSLSADFDNDDGPDVSSPGVLE